MICANAGDSRSILALKDGGVTPLSQDHKPSSTNENARIQAAGGFVQDDRVCGNLSVSRGLGDFEYKQNKDKNYMEQMITSHPDIKIIERDYDKHDMIIIGCDGIWDCIENKDCTKFLQEELVKEKKNRNREAEVIGKLMDKIMAKQRAAAKTRDKITVRCFIVIFRVTIER